MTLKDIAKQAGVSISTVSRVLNTPDGTYGNPKVQEKIWNIVRETGYMPNKSAQKLRSGESQSGQVRESNRIVCILGRAKSLDDDPFFAGIGHAVEQEALKLGYVVTAMYSMTKEHSDQDITNMLNTPAVGAIVIGRVSKKFQDMLNKHYKHIVFTGLQSMSVEWDQVVCDAYAIARDAVTYLYNHGHRNIGYIGKTMDQYRYQGYLDTMKILGLDVNPSHVISCNENVFKEGYNGMDRLLNNSKPLPTAVFCASDNVAIPAIRRMTEEKMRLPEEMSLISVHNLEMGQYTTPMLTSVDIPREQLGKSAVRHLIDRISHGNVMAAKIILPHRLVVRDSVVDLYT